MNGKSEPSMLRPLAVKGQKPRVAIVGAGFAGLRAADILLGRGVHVTIFEARNRVGGRVSASFHVNDRRHGFADMIDSYVKLAWDLTS